MHLGVMIDLNYPAQLNRFGNLDYTSEFIVVISADAKDLGRL